LLNTLTHDLAALGEFHRGHYFQHEVD